MKKKKKVFQINILRFKKIFKLKLEAPFLNSRSQITFSCIAEIRKINRQKLSNNLTINKLIKLNISTGFPSNMLTFTHEKYWLSTHLHAWQKLMKELCISPIK